MLDPPGDSVNAAERREAGMFRSFIMIKGPGNSQADVYYDYFTVTMGEGVNHPRRCRSTIRTQC